MDSGVWQRYLIFLWGLGRDQMACLGNREGAVFHVYVRVVRDLEDRHLASGEEARLVDRELGGEERYRGVVDVERIWDLAGLDKASRQHRRSVDAHGGMSVERSRRGRT